MATLSPGYTPGPRAVRASVGPATRRDDDPAVVVDRANRAGTGGILADGSPVEVDGAARIWLGPRERRARDGVETGEVVVDGWRVVVEIEPEVRAALRERARRDRNVAAAGGPVEVRAIIPGRIVALNAAPGDAVTAGQQLLVLEAMKMQNELRAPREGTVDRVAVAVGEDVEVGDLLLVVR